jgi:hypothetical protein
MFTDQVLCLGKAVGPNANSDSPVIQICYRFIFATRYGVETGGGIAPPPVSLTMPTT